MFAQVTQKKTFSVDEHVWLTALRVIVMFLCFFYRSTINWDTIQTCVIMVITFPYIHDGIYYTARNSFDSRVYPLRWKDESKTTDARISFSWSERKQLFTLGIILCVLLVITSLSNK